MTSVTRWPGDRWWYLFYNPVIELRLVSTQANILVNPSQYIHHVPMKISYLSFIQIFSSRCGNSHLIIVEVVNYLSPIIHSMRTSEPMADLLAEVSDKLWDILIKVGGNLSLIIMCTDGNNSGWLFAHEHNISNFIPLSLYRSIFPFIPFHLLASFSRKNFRYRYALPHSTNMINIVICVR